MFLYPTHVHPSSVVVVVVVAMETLWPEWFSLQHPIVLIVSGEKFSLTTQEDTNTHTLTRSISIRVRFEQKGWNR